MKSFEYWLNRIGIGLTLFGIAFLFKYSVDQGWITPWLRIAFAFTVGGILCGLGLRLYEKRENFAIVLLGGSIGVWYITGFSAFQLLNLVTQLQAMAFMVGVTIFAFSLSVRQNIALLALIGALGGFGTPFLLYTGSGNLPGLVMYTCLIVAMTSGLFFFKGWRSLLWLSVILSWIILMIGIGNRNWYSTLSGSYESWVTQGGLVFLWLSFTGIPLLRELAWLRNPDRWAKSTLGFADKKITPAISELLDRHLHLLALSSPFLGFTLSRIIWPSSTNEFWGWIAAGLCLLYAAVSYYLDRYPVMKALHYTYGLIGLFWFTLALTLILDGNILLVSLATEAMVLQLIARRINNHLVEKTAHLLFIAVTIWLWDRLTSGSHYPSEFFGAENLTNLWAIITLTVTALAVRQDWARSAYGLASIITLAILLGRLFSGNQQLLALAGEAFVVYLIARFTALPTINFSAHGLFLISSLLLAFRLTDPAGVGIAIFNANALTELVVISLILLVSMIGRELIVRRIYQIVTIMLVAGLIVREFGLEAELLILGLEGVAIMWFARTAKDQIFQYTSHIFMALLFIKTAQLMIQSHYLSGLLPCFNLTAAASLSIIVMTIWISRWQSERQIDAVYKFIAHAGILGWLALELSRLADGHGWVSISWGIYGTSLLILGLRRNSQPLRLVAMGTLMLLVIKLFMFDLARLETIWRVLLFIGVGGSFLILSYFFPTLWKDDSKE